MKPQISFIAQSRTNYICQYQITEIAELKIKSHHYIYQFLLEGANQGNSVFQSNFVSKLRPLRNLIFMLRNPEIPL